MMIKVLFVLTSHDELGDTGHKTGFWIDQFTAPYYLFLDNGVDVTIASPKGGKPPIDPKSDLPEASTPSMLRFNNDADTQHKLAHTIMLTNIKETDFDAIYFPGGHGPLWDLAVDKSSINLVEAFYRNNKPVAAVCHAPAVFRYAKNTLGEPLVKGKKITSATNEEEAGAGLIAHVPFLVEDMLKENGAAYSKANNWEPYVIQDGLLITGQNHASAQLVAEKLFNLLDNK